MHQGKDRGAKWLIGRQLDGILKVAGVTGFSRWQPGPAEVVAPRRIPDGWVDLFFPDDPKPVPYLIEVETYPDRSADPQVFEDIQLIRVERGVVPEVIFVILHPKGKLAVTGQVQETSRSGRTRLGASWPVLELWTLNAADLFAMNDVGVVPWIPLTKFDGPPDAVFRQCRDRIDQQAAPRDREGLLVVTQILASVAFPDRGLLSIFGGENAMIESPLLTELEEKITKRVSERTRQGAILDNLDARFGPVPEDISTLVRSITEEKRLTALHRLSATCLDLAAFRVQLTTPA